MKTAKNWGGSSIWTRIGAFLLGAHYITEKPDAGTIAPACIGPWLEGGVHAEINPLPLWSLCSFGPLGKCVTFSWWSFLTVHSLFKRIWDSVPILEIWPHLFFPLHPLPVTGLHQAFFPQHFNHQARWMYELYSGISQDKLGYAAKTNNPKISVA